MIKEVYKDIYQIQIKLPDNPLKALNTYLIKGEDKSLLIDTGFNRKECRQELFQALEELEIDLKKLDVFLTHHHADHSGQVYRFKESSENIYAGSIDGRLVNEMSQVSHWEGINSKSKIFDLDQDQVSYLTHPGFKFATPETVDFVYLEEGDLIEIGDYKLKVIFTPGHTPGQIGLLIEDKGIYFSGDHVLDIITPNISFYGYEERDLETYLASLNKVRDLDLKLILPSHRNIMEDHPRRVDEIIQHHRERLEEVYDIITSEPQSVRTVARQMEWRIRAKDWEDFPKPQKWFASSEAMSHLEYLYNAGRIKRENRDGVVYYSL